MSISGFLFFGLKEGEYIAPSVRALKIFDIAQVTATKKLHLRHAVPGPELKGDVKGDIRAKRALHF